MTLMNTSKTGFAKIKTAILSDVSETAARSIEDTAIEDVTIENNSIFEIAIFCRKESIGDVLQVWISEFLTLFNVNVNGKLFLK